jgi:hypothetical protein
MRRLLRQELEKGWIQPDTQYITPEMINTSLQISSEAAHQAAAAYQQEQASLAWQQQSNLAWQQARESLRGGTSGALLLPPQMSDPSLQLPRHVPLGLTAQMLSGHNYQPAPGMPVSVPMHLQSPPKASPGPNKVNRNDKGTKGQRKGSGKGNGVNAAVNKKNGRNGDQGSQGNAPSYNGSGGHAATAQNPQGGFDNSLRANLETLQSMDCNSIIQVRKINRLGFESSEALKEHFSKYGKVDRVLVSHCYAKARNLRFRPSGLGFVVMSAAEEVQAILADGPEIWIRREVDGVLNEVPVRVQAFKPQKALEAEMEDEA